MREKKMKFKGSLEPKKKMLVVARPLVDLFFPRASEKKKRKLIGRAVRDTDWFSSEDEKYVEDLLDKENISVCAFYDKIFGKMRFSKDSDYSSYVHELIHYLGNKISKNHLALANALDNYFETLKLFKQFQVGYCCVDTSRQLAMTSLTSDEIKDASSEYKNGHEESGKNIGLIAVTADYMYKKEGSGIFFIKMINDSLSGVEIHKRFSSGNVVGLESFLNKHEKALSEITRVKEYITLTDEDIEKYLSRKGDSQ